MDVLNMDKKRLNSVKTNVKHITSGRYVAQDGMNPNYVLTGHGARLSRVRILGTVVDKFVAESGKFASVTLDDGTDTIRVKAFNNVSLFEKIDVGTDIDLVARVKEYQGEIYLAPEIITPVDDKNFALLRELEIRSQTAEIERKRKIVLEHRNQAADVSELQRLMKERFGIHPEEVEAIVQTQDTPEEPSGDKNKESILKLIEKLDEGSGCDYTELLKVSGLPEDVIDSVVNELLEQGVCFEPRPGKIKKL
jgi:RPA family protein